MDLDTFLKVVLYLLAVIPTVTLITTYIITEKRNDSSLTVPFISSSIDYSPGSIYCTKTSSNFTTESCIGSLGLVMTAALAFVAIFTKYLQLAAIIDHHEASLRITKVKPATLSAHNTAGFIIGCISLFGLVGVASFQYHNVPIAHLTFAIMFFFGIGMMASLERRIGEEGRITSIRMFLAVLSIIFFFPATIPMFWGYENTSATFEIINAATIFSYVLTYYKEFSRIKLRISIVDPKFMRSITQEEARMLMSS